MSSKNSNDTHKFAQALSKKVQNQNHTGGISRRAAMTREKKLGMLIVYEWFLCSPKRTVPTIVKVDQHGPGGSMKRHGQLKFRRIQWPYNVHAHKINRYLCAGIETAALPPPAGAKKRQRHKKMQQHSQPCTRSVRRATHSHRAPNK